MEECYEKLKNGYDESADFMDSDSNLYNSQVFEGQGHAKTNAPSQDAPWGSQGLPLEIPPGHFRAAPGYPPESSLPYPQDDHGMPRSPVAERKKRSSKSDPDSGEFVVS